MPTINKDQCGIDLMRDGIHAVTVIDAKPQTSRAGNEMIHLRLEDIQTKERCSTNIVFTAKTGRIISAFCAAIDLIMPDEGGEFLLEARFCRGRVLFIDTAIDDSAEFGEQVRVTRYLTRDRAFKLRPELEGLGIPENSPFKLPMVLSGSPTATTQTAPRSKRQGWTDEEFRAEMERRAAAAKASLEEPFNMPEKDDFDMSPPAAAA